MFCEKCGSPIAEGSKFCSNCGAEVRSTAFHLVEVTCPGCGAELEIPDTRLDSIECQFCGKKFMFDDEAARERRMREVAREDALARLHMVLNAEQRQNDIDFQHTAKHTFLEWGSKLVDLIVRKPLPSVLVLILLIVMISQGIPATIAYLIILYAVYKHYEW